MRIIQRRGPIGIVISKQDGELAALSAHLTLIRYQVDEDGQICLTSELPIENLCNSVELMKTQLDALIGEALERLAAG